MYTLKSNKSFSVDDIREIRNFNYEFTKNMPKDEVRKYYKETANIGFATIEQIRKARV